MKKNKKSIAAISLVIVLLIGVAFLVLQIGEKKPNELTKPQNITPLANALYENKNPYIGDPSQNGAILSLLKIEENLGDYQIELQTNKAPYVLKLLFQNKVEYKDRDAFDLQMQKYAFVLLALIENAGEIQWSYASTELDGQETEITVYVKEDDAKTILGEKVKKFATSPEFVQALLEQLELAE